MPEEGERFRALGRLCAEAMDARRARRSPRPDRVSNRRATGSRGAKPWRAAYRQPHRHRRAHFQIPPSAAHRQKARTLRHARVVWAQVGPGVLHHAVRSLWPLPDDVRRKAEATARIDATFIAATRPGQRLGKSLAARQPPMQKPASPTNGSCTTKAARLAMSRASPSPRPARPMSLPWVRRMRGTRPSPAPSRKIPSSSARKAMRFSRPSPGGPRCPSR